MKKIAIDLDGVVFDTENLYRIYTEIHDVEAMKKDNLIDNTKRIFQKRYNWPEEEFKKFYNENAKEILTSANIMTGAEIVLEKLKEHFELIIVTARNDIEIEYTKAKLDSIGLKDLKYFNNEHDKIDRLIREKADYIIDDDEETCKKASFKNIKAIYFKNAASPLIKEHDNFKIVNNWGEIYKYLMLFENKK